MLCIHVVPRLHFTCSLVHIAVVSKPTTQTIYIEYTVLKKRVANSNSSRGDQIKEMLTILRSH